MNKARQLFALLRISHWSKAIFVLLGVFYSEQTGYWPQALLAAFSFCLIASAVYIYNDLQDIEEDKRHPHKSKRPIASANVSIQTALTFLGVLLLCGLSLAIAISTKLAVIIAVYLLINIVYNHWLRMVPFLDAVCVASGFMLRVLAGTVGIGLPLTTWLTAAATLLSLFIALSKRQLESQLTTPEVSRAVLEKYHPKLLQTLLTLTAIGCFFTYLFYIIYIQNEASYFLFTLPFAAFGLWRFLRLMTEEHIRDDPVFVLINDRLSFVNLLCFFILTLVALSQ